MKQVKTLDYRDWQPTIQLAVPQRSDAEVLSEAESGRFRYLAFLDNANSVPKYRFMQTAIALRIPRDRWPSFGTLVLPNPMRVDIEMPPFVPPHYDVLRDSAETWRKKADRHWNEYRRTCLAKTREEIRRRTEGGSLVPQATRREHGKASPMELRLKWAVLHYCKGWSYARLYRPQYNAGKKHTEDAITRATQKLLNELGLRQRR
jgi:hypothetical protein